MAVPFSNTKLRVPVGFQGVLELIAKEVLLEQPTDIIACAANYCDKLLKLRAEGSVDPVKDATDIQDRYYNNKSFQNKALTEDDPGQQMAAVKIQSKYRQYKAKEELEGMKQDHAALRIQAGYRGYVARKSVKHIREENPKEDHSSRFEEENEEKMSETEQKRNEAVETGRTASHENSARSQKSTTGVESPKDTQDSESGRLSGIEGKSAKDKITVSHLPALSSASKKTSPAVGRENNGVITTTSTAVDNVKPMTSANDIAEPKSAGEVDGCSYAIANPKSCSTNIDTKHSEDIMDTNVDGKGSATMVEARVSLPEPEEEIVDEKVPLLATEKKDELNESTCLKQAEVKEEEEEVIDIDLKDPEVEKAAILIGSKFKGMKLRKAKSSPNDAMRVTTKISDESKTVERIDAKSSTDTSQAEEQDVGEKADRSNNTDNELLNKVSEDNMKIDQLVKVDEEKTTKSESLQIETKNLNLLAAESNVTETSPTENVEMKEKPSVTQEQDNRAEDQPKKETEEEVIDIDLEDPDVEKAAILIGSKFKGMKLRKAKSSPASKITKPETASSAAAESLSAQLSASEEVKVKGDSMELQESSAKTEVSSVIGSASMKPETTELQEKVEETVKGLEIAEELKEASKLENVDLPEKAELIEKSELLEKTEQQLEKADQLEKIDQLEKAEPEEKAELLKKAEELKSAVEEEVIDIDLNDPEVEKAAKLIQTGFKGLKLRKAQSHPAKTAQSESLRKTKSDVQSSTAEEVSNTTKVQANTTEVHSSSVDVQSGTMELKSEVQADNTNVSDKIEAVMGTTGIQQDMAKINVTSPVNLDPNCNESAVAPSTQDLNSNVETVDDNAVTTDSEKAKNSESENLEVSEQNKTEEEEIDIDLKDPEVEKAALLIQSNFKGMKFRKAKSSPIRLATDSADQNLNIEQQTSNDKSEKQNNADEVLVAPSEISSGVSAGVSSEVKPSAQAQEEEIDIDLNDPEVEKAAKMIQSNFKGLKLRKNRSAPAASIKTATEKENKDNIDVNNESKPVLDNTVIVGHESAMGENKCSNKNEEALVNKEECMAVQSESEKQEKDENSSYPMSSVKSRIKLFESLSDPQESIPVKKEDSENSALTTDDETAAKNDQEMNSTGEENAKIANLDKQQCDMEIGCLPTREENTTLVQSSSNSGETSSNPVTSVPEEEIIDIDFTDPEVEKAAVLIQAGFKGLKRRKTPALKEPGDNNVEQMEKNENITCVADIHSNDAGKETHQNQDNAEIANDSTRESAEIVNESNEQMKQIQDNAETVNDSSEQIQDNAESAKDSIRDNSKTVNSPGEPVEGEKAPDSAIPPGHGESVEKESQDKNMADVEREESRKDVSDLSANEEKRRMSNTTLSYNTTEETAANLLMQDESRADIYRNPVNMTNDGGEAEISLSPEKKNSPENRETLTYAIGTVSLSELAAVNRLVDKDELVFRSEENKEVLCSDVLRMCK